jgi:hypothetical protein
MRIPGAGGIPDPVDVGSATPCSPPSFLAPVQPASGEDPAQPEDRLPAQPEGCPWSA